MANPTDPICVGDRIADNDPRMKGRILLVASIADEKVTALDSRARPFEILRKRIHTDNKTRRSGFSRIGAAT